jgi:prophage regulatory protein
MTRKNKEHKDIRELTNTKILRERQVKDLTGLSRVTRWRLERNGRFPCRVQLSQRCVGWPEYEVLDWLKERVEARKSHTVAPIAPSMIGGAK